MKIGIIVAMSKELRLILPMLENPSVRTVGQIEFHLGTIHGHDVAVMECGIGKVNAAMGATVMCMTFSPDLVINTGVGAGAGEEVAVLDSIVATGVIHHDFWCIGEEWGHVPGSSRVLPAVPFEEYVAGSDVKFGHIASGDMFITSRGQVDEIRSHCGPILAVDMESAAIAQVCERFATRFFCLRVVSDSPWCSHDNSRQYESFWEDAPERSFALVSTLLSKLPSKFEE